MERALLNSGLGFRLRFSTSSANENHRLPGLAFADDLVIMAENREDLQTLLDICQVEISRIGLCFSTRKSAVVCLAGGLTDPAVLTLGGEPLPRDRAAAGGSSGATYPPPAVLVGL
ncbi:hypothetical protein HPB49_010673 [Dermacentor silvarum]|uniref:Uncharacterized protein n=1 Tax=Dermacentor silvarum TaxID=543639 RepID=A0ACB8CEJ7_DERSI|nr:hypothetical protein HPB49_010673 [Dermacentor silvarum]